MVSIELLDYKYSSTGETSVNQVNFSNVTNQDDWVVVSDTKIEIDTHSGTDYIYPVTSKLLQGATYFISITIADKTGADDIGFSTISVAGTTYSALSTLRSSSSGTFSTTFTTTAANEQLRIFAQADAAATVTARVSLVGGVDFNKSVLGRLDIGNSDDFPLAVTFGIIDVRNLQERTGTYSKTFNIPATKNNNQILKALYREGSFTDGASLTGRMPCRISLDSLNSIFGKLQITKVGNMSRRQFVSYYSCVFYGDNVDWTSSISEKKLMDLSVLNGAKGSGWDNLNNKGANTGVDLKLQYMDIKDSWFADNALEKSVFVQAIDNSLDYWESPPVANDYPIVYPYVSYGEFGGVEGGAVGSLYPYKSIQLLKFWSQVYGSIGEDAYWGANISNILPTVDWRPGIFIYDIFKQIFAQEGFTISSAFIETDMFKKLIMLLPNFTYNNASERNSELGQRITFESGYLSSIDWMPTTAESSSFNWYPTSGIQWNNTSKMINDPNYSGNLLATSSFIIKEFGYYNVNMKNIGAELVEACNPAANGASTCRIEYVKIMCRTRMVGQTAWADWKTIATSYGKEDSTPADNYAGCPNFYPVSPTNAESKIFNFDDISIENRWFNKGDYIDFAIKWKFGHNDNSNKAAGSEFHIFGGSSGSTGFGNDGEVSVVLSSPSTVDFGNTFDLKNVIPDDSTQMDFLRGVTHAFNLQYRTDVNSKIVYIEPYDDFFRPLSEALDWTDKVDLSQIQEDIFPESTLMSRIIFKFKTDSSDQKVAARAALYFDNILDEFPHKEDLSDEFKTGVSVFENPFFAGTYTTSDDHSKNDTLWTACLWKNCSDGNVPFWNGACRPEQGFSNLPRLLSWSKMECRSIDSSAGTAINGYSFLWTKAASSLSCNSGVPYAIGNMCLGRTIPKAVSRDFTMEDTSPTPFLAYGSGKQQKFACDFNTTYSQQLDKGLYQTYWERQIEQLKLNPRIKNIYIRLNNTDIANLDLRKLIYISGYYYRINKINDYIAGSTTTKVELLLWSEQGNFAAKDSFNNSGIMR